MAKHLETGKKGEALAVDFLKEKGYEIVETNWRFRRSEVDIIAKDGKILVFVEVKTRSYDYFGKPESFVSARKKTLLQDAASAYTHQVKHTWEIRFDIIGILLRSEADIEISHFEDAFFPGML
ncbi:MAG: YraN family protein [Bacteroidota bacterium]